MSPLSPYLRSGLAAKRALAAAGLRAFLDCAAYVAPDGTHVFTAQHARVGDLMVRFPPAALAPLPAPAVTRIRGSFAFRLDAVPRAGTPLRAVPAPRAARSRRTMQLAVRLSLRRAAPPEGLLRSIDAALRPQLPHRLSAVILGELHG